MAYLSAVSWYTISYKASKMASELDVKYLIYVVYRQKVSNPVIEPMFLAFMLGTIAIYIIHVVLAFNGRIYWEIISSTPSFFFYGPTYIHVLMIYAFCKIDDFSWGTKGLD